MKRLMSMLLLAAMSSLVLPSSAQSLFHRADSILAARYYRLGNIDTAYITRPQTKWTITARLNVSGAKIGAEAASGMGQHATLDWDQEMKLKMTNIGLGAGYGYNYVPGQGWLLHISGLPTFIVYSNTSMTFGDDRIPLRYHFPEVIITGRGAVIRQWGNKFLGISMVFNFTNIGDKDNLTVQNNKWRIRTFFGLRLGKR